MITLAQKSCVTILLFPLDIFRLPLEMSKFRRNLCGVALNWDATHKVVYLAGRLLLGQYLGTISVFHFQVNGAW